LVFVFLNVLRVGVEVRVRTTSGVTFPFTSNGELSPGTWENLANINSVVVSLPVLKAHPEIPIKFE
jgi:hypothetical protein